MWVWFGEPNYKKSPIVPGINITYGSLAVKVKTMPSYLHQIIIVL